jgi:hypothetical protein
MLLVEIKLVEGEIPEVPRKKERNFKKGFIK